MNSLSDLLHSVQSRASEWIAPTKVYVINGLLGIGAKIVWNLAYWGVFDLCTMVYKTIYRQYTPSICFEFLSSNGEIVNTQYYSWKTAVDNYAYLVYTNNELKSFVPKSIADTYRRHPQLLIQRPIKPPFGSAGVTFVEKADYTSDMIDIEFKTSEYNYFVCGNVINKCTFAYFIKKHYPNLVLPSTYTLTIFTHTYCLKTYDLNEGFFFRDDLCKDE
jgi:hypothetical protein